MLIATDSLKKHPLAGALVTGESEEEVVFLLEQLKKWLPSAVTFMTIDFSTRLEAGVNLVFPNILVQKCVFHAIQLLTRGLLKEFTKIKKEYLLNHIKEWKALRKYTLSLEKDDLTAELSPFQFNDVELAKEIYGKLRCCVTLQDSQQIEQALLSLFSTPLFNNWEGKRVFASKYEAIFAKRNFTFSKKSIKYIVPMIYKGFRAAIREIRKKVEEKKSRFNKAKYLVLMNPVNMKPYHRRKLRKYLKEFPWLRPYRKLLVKFYYQFRVPPEKRVSLSFLSRLISDASHTWLKAAVQTLIEHEEKVFRYQCVSEKFPKVKYSKSIKVVNESVNKLVSQLYQTQCGMRTLENIRMRVSNRLDCPIIISPALVEKVK
ncbi:MAG: hypothetical protein EU517_00915 [Promethearchaeota archaeon]|nr:MAG: hypothetical protein EU517_00915 [Candidatus Lokiarchaeota archaeon]